jgi:hypothetical protein
VSPSSSDSPRNTRRNARVHTSSRRRQAHRRPPRDSPLEASLYPLVALSSSPTSGGGDPASQHSLTSSFVGKETPTLLGWTALPERASFCSIIFSALSKQSYLDLSWMDAPIHPCPALLPHLVRSPTGKRHVNQVLIGCETTCVVLLAVEGYLSIFRLCSCPRQRSTHG